MATRWGIVSVGAISTDFVLAISTLPSDEHQVVAVAARDLTRATEFANIHKIKNAYGSYEELAKDSNVDVVYIGTINTEHLRLGKLFLEAGKPVLCEKPLCMNRKEVDELIQVARNKKLFLMEAIWSRMNPLYRELREAIASDTLGEVVLLQADFGVVIDKKARVAERALGGSALLDIGIYCIQLALYLFGHPNVIKAIGTTNADGVDDTGSILMQFPGNKSAVLTFNAKVQLPNEARITGTKGFAVLRSPFWTPTELNVNGKTSTLTLPEAHRPFRYANSAALRFEAQEVRSCLLQGLTESTTVSWSESLAIADIEDEIRRQIGVVFDQD